MKKQLSITVLILLCSAYCMAAGNVAEQWKRGNLCYLEKRYDSAAWYYEQLAAAKPRNAELYYNLGNSYYRLNKIPQSVLNYERSLAIDPNNMNASDNLAIAQARISNHIQAVGDIFFIKWWHSLTQPQRATGWSVAALLTFLLIIALLWVRRFVKNGSAVPVQLPGILTFVCICLLVLAGVSADNSTSTSGAVVMENDAPLMNNQQKGKPLALIPEGTTVKILSENGMWVEVTLPDGRNGWLMQNEISRI
jgi:hypothetical protein